MRQSIGVDLVHIPGFLLQLQEPGTTMVERSFSARERRDAQARARARGAQGLAGQAQHLAARWAAKEAFIKAWCSLVTQPVMSMENVTWTQVETLTDRWGCPRLMVSGDMLHAVRESVGEFSCSVSLSHDGDTAIATVLLSAP